MALGVVGALFAVFAANVVSGALFGAPFLSDVLEMLTLAATAIAFVVAVLRREAAEKRRAAGNQ